MICPLRFLRLPRFTSESISSRVLVFLKNCTARFQMAKSQTFGDRKFFTEKLLAEKTENAKSFHRNRQIWISSVPCAYEGSVCFGTDAKSNPLDALLIAIFSEFYRWSFREKKFGKNRKNSCFCEMSSSARRSSNLIGFNRSFINCQLSRRPNGCHGVIRWFV